MSGWTPTRRRLLGAVGTVGTAAITGCQQLATGDEATTDEETTHESTPTARETERRGETAGVADEAATQAADWREARIETTKRLAANVTIQTGTDEERQTVLQNEREVLSDAVYRVHYANFADERTIVASTDGVKVGHSLTVRASPWQNDQLRFNEAGVFVARTEEALGRSLLSVVAPVENDADGQFYLVVQADLDVLGGELPTDSEAGFTHLVDDERRIVASSEATELLSRNDGSLTEYHEGIESPALQRGLDGESGAVRQTHSAKYEEGQQVYRAAFAPVAGAQWVAIAHEPVEGGDDGLF